MIRYLTPFFALLALAATARAELTVISAEHRDANSFKRVSEYLTGKHSDGRYAIFRSDNSRRDGFYVSLLAKDKDTLPSVSSVRIQFVRPGTQEITSFETTTGKLAKKRILVGLTETEWLDEDSHPVAWKIDLLDSSGNTLESAKSFLWSEPSS
ncbi:hypothetical protein VDG1235_3041 [Verrucomicrobiia bacterium DG1235]|nr:hypothetical protein VDG1235_3041 [Verrucomicrobiae bacterium DG1235]